MFCRSLLTITLAALHISIASAATGGPQGCAIFDVNWNLLALGFNGKDYNAGTQDTWTSTTPAEDITASNRPPFNSPNTTCYLAQFYNAIYVLNADSANPTSIYIYAVSTKSWSMQSVTVTSNTVDYTNFAVILDHDTNVFYACSEGGDLSSLDMGSLTVANSTAIPWIEAQKVDLSNDTSGQITPGANTAGYQPVIALAQNHIHFLGVPGLPAGDVKIFVIHYSYMQPAPQSMGSFPTTHGKTASIFQQSGVQQAFVFVPDDGSGTFVIDVETNTTQTLPGPSEKDPLATYSASTTALVQLTITGEVFFLPVPNGTTWSPVSSLPKADFSTSSSNTSSSSASGTASGATSSSTSSATTGSNASSGIRTVDGGMQLAVGMALAVLLGFVALVL